jgi:Bacterial Ig-like domain
MNRYTFLVLLVVLLSACGDTTSTPSTTKPTITSFTASPSTLPAGGGSVTLSWDVKDATSLSIDNGVGAVTGTSKTVTATSSKTFTLTATNEAGSVTQSTSVSVGAGADTTSPTVVAIYPPDGATGVKEDQSIVITFDEKMDQAATEAAYQSADLPATEVTFSWNTEGTTLTIKPKDFLEYAAGDSSSIAAKTYALSVTSNADDVAGNALTPFSSSFSTLKVISAAIYAAADQTGYIEDVGGDLLSGSPTAAICVGDSNFSSPVRGFFGFDLTGIPEGAVADKARLIIYKEGVKGAPYALSSVFLEHVSYPVPLIDSGESSYQYDTPVLSDLGIFDSTISPATGYLSSDVISEVVRDLRNRVEQSNRSQYRLRAGSNGDDTTDCVQFTGSEGPNGQRPFLNVVYYIP